MVVFGNETAKDGMDILWTRGLAAMWVLLDHAQSPDKQQWNVVFVFKTTPRCFRYRYPPLQIRCAQGLNSPAQLVEQSIRNRPVMGSSPIGGSCK
jgi:hypothetical protein